ncbi:MAG: putative cytosol aminopeptidase [Rhodomicrobium sp.]|nr:MAG: putative cytosol aminopeptidase [Rhodomicrobium sp.]
MTKSAKLTFEKLSLPKGGTLILLSEEEGGLSPLGQSLDKETDQLISKAIKVADFKSKKNSLLEILSPGTTNYDRIIIAGIGIAENLSAVDARLIGGSMTGALLSKKITTATIIAENINISGDLDLAANIALGAALRQYNFDKYKKKPADSDKTNTFEIKSIAIQSANPSASKKLFNSDYDPLCHGITTARDLVNEPANILGPDEYAKRIAAMKSLGLEVDILDEKALKKLGMNALLGVGEGSRQGAYLAVMKWNGAPAKSKEAPIAIVGKGVTFDTGGISIKGAGGMEDMKGDMGGSATVVGLMHTLAKRKAKVDVIGVVGLVENMPDGMAQRPGDIVTSMSGQTIEIINTDAEGRLVLADALWYTQDKFNPKYMINLATLTGAIMVALGKDHAGMFSNDDELADMLTSSGNRTGEKLWRMPLGASYDKLINSQFADMKNTGGRWGGAITAAQFLQRYVNETPWAHLDIAGVAMASNKTATSQSWGSGFGVDLLNDWIKENFEG